MRRRVLAWVLIATGLILGVATAALTVLEATGMLESELDARDVVDAIFLALPGTAFFAVGSLLTVRRSANPVGWLCLVIGLCWMILGANESMKQAVALQPVLESHQWINWFTHWVPPVGLMATHLPLRLPDGELPSPRWVWYSRFCTVAIVVAFVIMVTEPGPDSPLPISTLQVLRPLFILLPLSFVGAIGSLALRYRRSVGPARLQLREIALAGVVLVVVYGIALVGIVWLLPEDSWMTTVVSNLVFVAYAGIPLAIGLAVFRYRLYDIDAIINRALVYSALSAALVGMYVVGVLVLQLTLRPLTDRSDLAVAGSTLAVAALFRPARDRIQSAVDRRFYRSRYDAAQTLADFNSRLREQLDLEALSADLQVVVRRTVQPAHLSLWLRAER